MRVGRNPYLVTTRLFHTTRLLESVEYILLWTGLLKDFQIENALEKKLCKLP